MPHPLLLIGVIGNGKLDQIFQTRLQSKSIQYKYQQIMITFIQMKALKENNKKTLINPQSVKIF